MPATRAVDVGTPSAFPENQVFQLDFSKLVLSANQGSSTVQAWRFLPTALKIYRVIAGFDSGTVAGACSINIVSGTAAEIANSGGTIYTAVPIPETDYASQPVSPGAQAYPPAYATAGQRLFLSDQALTMTASTATVLTPEDSAATGAYAAGTPGKTFDALWGPAGSLITLRTVTGAGASGNLYVAMLCKIVLPNQGLSGSQVLTSFDPATSIP
jgi:hypothetical protein